MHTRLFLWITIFSIAMGFMESAVVIYLREIYYPHGFNFPLVPIEADIGLVEFYREAATIIMLLGIGLIAGKTTSMKFALFIYSFAVWDIVYYIFLKLFLNWPESLLTWDILFLIPLPWVGPVITPIIVSLSMIILSCVVMHYHNKGINTRIKRKEWMLLISGSLVVILSWMWDYLNYINSAGELKNAWTLSDKDAILLQVASYVPKSFFWPLFVAGMALILAGTFIYMKRLKSARR